MRDVEGRNAPAAAQFRDLALEDGIDIRVLELDVRSQESANSAVAAALAQEGHIDVVVHNAGHLALGYTEAFTDNEVSELFEVNAISVQRLNRAVLPHLRSQGSGLLLYVGSTTTVSVPPFLGPYVASKFAFDALAQVTAYEVSQFGIETVIVMPGAFTKGTEHFGHASSASDAGVTAAYARLDAMVAGYEAATEGLFDPAIDADPISVAREIARIVELPVGDKPFRSVIDFTQSDVALVNEVARASAADFLRRMGFERLLQVRTKQ